MIVFGAGRLAAPALAAPRSPPAATEGPGDLGGVRYLFTKRAYAGRIPADAAITALGFTPQHEASSTDSNLPMSLGVAAVTIGAGGRGDRAGLGLGAGLAHRADRPPLDPDPLLQGRDVRPGRAWGPVRSARYRAG